MGYRSRVKQKAILTILENLYSHIPRIVVGYVILTGILYSLFTQYIILPLFIAWCLLFFLNLAYRVYIYKRFRTEKKASYFYQKHFAIGVVSTGVFMGLIPWFLTNDMARVDFYFFILIFIAVIAVGVSHLWLENRLVKVYNALIISSLMLKLILFEDIKALVLIPVLIIYILFLLSFAHQLYRRFLKSIYLEHRSLWLNEALQRQKEQFKIIFENAPVGLLFYDKHYTIVDINDFLLELFHTTRKEMMLLNLKSLRDNRLFASFEEAFLSGEGEYYGSYTTTIKKVHLQLLLKTKALRNQEGTILGAVAIIQNVSELLRLKQEINSFAEFYIQNPNPVFRIDYTFEVVIQNAPATTLIEQMKQAGAYYSFIEKLKQNRRSFEFEMHGKAYLFDIVHVEHDKFFNIYVKDITKEKEALAELEFLARHDELTKLVRKNTMLQEVNVMVELSKIEKLYHALIFFDLDNFKGINDTLGHDLGDELLKEVGNRLQELISEDVLVSRFGGDEFVILIKRISTSKDTSALRALRVAKSVKDLLAREFRIGEHKVYITASIGIDLFVGDKNPIEVLKKADTAMYHAKNIGKNSIKFFDESLEKNLRHELELLTKLHRVLKEGGLEVYYQPQVDINQEKIVGAEALLRWRNEDGTFISPALFVPVAERSGLIDDIGKFVIRRVFEDKKELQDIIVAINISSIQIHKSNFVKEIVALSERYKIDTSTIELEITESTFSNDFEMMVEKMNTLKTKGFKISIDDFGTGYSSLHYIKNLPIDYIKIDRSFISDIGLDHKDEVMVKIIVDMAQNLHLKTIAEGAETQEHIDFLKSIHCDIYQGYYCSEALPLEQFKALLKA